MVMSIIAAVPREPLPVPFGELETMPVDDIPGLFSTGTFQAVSVDG
jgi:hypothetical protein